MMEQNHAVGVLAALISGKNRSVLNPRTADTYVGSPVDGNGPDVLMVHLDDGTVLHVTVQVLA